MSDDKNNNIKSINISDVFNKYKGIIIGTIFIIVGMLFYLIMQVFNLWTNPPAAGPSIFCEYFDPDLLVGEPINAWSNYYYVGAGMLVILYYDLIRMGKIEEKDRYLHRKENRHYLLTYGMLLIWVGLASFYMHGSYRSNEWFSAGFLDVLSMNMFISGIAVLSLAILFDIKKRNFYVILLIDFILMVILMKSNLSLPSVGGGGLFELLIIATFINEVLVSLGIYSWVFKKKRARQIRRNFFLLVIVLSTFLISFWLWHYGKPGVPTCDPYSWWQWHAVWHFLDACAMLFIALYMLTERERMAK